MYLKHLVLKGFKSFADRSSLQLEPGITAVVGPNGSGKSNISDAVLWVLGERNARNLRGQSMEDVIFSGSSARKATGVAEVSLVLDNSDGTLPVDFNEVVITRRMYRSGESEYLINNTLARRMDVLDILHDSGLGTGTHSIISQGSLDSILRSDPQERRSLIEEAAGVLKHKQRKERSERKIQKMDTYLQRVRDVVGEVERQLAPLARKAKKAQTYAEISGQLAQAKLTLAVDDLRKLQLQWHDMQAKEQSLETSVSSCKKAVIDAEMQVEELQEKVRIESADGAQLTKNYQACSSAAERLDSVLMLARDRRRNALERSSELGVSIEANTSKRDAALRDLETTNQIYQKSNNELSVATEKVTSLKNELQIVQNSSRNLRENFEKLTKDSEEFQLSLDEARINLAQTKESITNRLAHMKVTQGRVDELELDLARVKSDVKELLEKSNAAQDALSLLEEQQRSARTFVATCMNAKDAAVRALDEAKQTSQSLAAQISALEELERASEKSAGSTRAWVAERAQSLPGNVSSLISVIKPDMGYEGIVETLLSNDVMSLLVDDFSSVKQIESAVASNDLDGALHMLIRKDASPAKNIATSVFKSLEDKSSLNANEPLIKHISYSDEISTLIEALLGDVVICADFDAALLAHAQDEIGCRFATLSGQIIWPNGKVVLNAKDSKGNQGVLERVRHLSELKSGLQEALEITEKAEKQVVDAQESLSSAQSDSLKLSEQLAQLRGDAESVKRQYQEVCEKQKATEKDYEDALRTMNEANGAISSAEPKLAEYQAQIDEYTQKLEDTTSLKQDISAELIPLEQKLDILKAELSNAELETAKLQERAQYNQRVAARHAEDLQTLADSIQQQKELSLIKKQSAERLKIIIAIISQLERNAQSRADSYENEADAAQNSSSGLYAQVASARNKSQEAHAAFDDATEKLNQVKVELARMEMQVQTAVDLIVIDCETPIETALLEPVLENRMEVEEVANSLTRRIANLGTINPDAAMEYEELKSRYDYLAGQLSDLDSAAKSLSRIGRVIEERMKDDFANTFQKVNENFQEIFAILFPGGSANLTLDLPDDLENSGVEVNAQPAGKRISKMSLMSGGEKSLTALALLFALYRTRSTPFYILDEVEAALDDTNLRRLVGYMERLRDETQLIMITHQRRTMEMADVLFGVSMQADGVTKVVSQRLEHALKYAE